MNDTISTEDLIAIVEESGLDPTIKEILIRDIRKEGVNDFYVEQVMAYCDKAIDVLQHRASNQSE